MELRQLTLKAHLGWVNMRPQNFLVCGPKFIKFLSSNVEGVVVDHVFGFFQMFDISIRSGDICDQTRKLSKIAPKFGRFLALQTFQGAGLPNTVRTLSPLPRGTSSGKVS